MDICCLGHVLVRLLLQCVELLRVCVIVNEVPGDHTKISSYDLLLRFLYQTGALTFSWLRQALFPVPQRLILIMEGQRRDIWHAGRNLALLAAVGAI